MTITSLRHQVRTMLRKQLPAPEENYLVTQEWPALRSLLERESAPYPDAAIAIRGAIAHLERVGRCRWEIVQQAIYTALGPYMDARVAIAEALMQAHDSLEAVQ